MFALARTSSGGANKTIVLSAIFIGGITECSLQIVLLIAFQTLYGSVYYKLGLIFMMFMAGTALGAFAANKNKRTNPRTLIALQSLYIIQAAAVPPILILMQRTPPGIVTTVTELFLFPLLPALTGLIGGLQFPKAANFFYREKQKLGAASGIAYGMDLMGAALGSLLISFFILPLGGVKNTCMLLVLINALAVFMLFALKETSADYRRS